MGDCLFQVDSSRIKLNSLGRYNESRVNLTRSILLTSSLILLVILTAVVALDDDASVDMQQIELETTARVVGIQCIPDLCAGDAAAVDSILACLKNSNKIAWAWVLDKNDNMVAAFSHSGTPSDLLPEAIAAGKQTVRKNGLIFACQPIVKGDQKVGRIVVAAREEE